jgi:hypothetical protein
MSSCSTTLAPQLLRTGQSTRPLPRDCLEGIRASTISSLFFCPAAGNSSSASCVPACMVYDLRFALRMIHAHGWFSAAVVATLALGIGLNTMVFTLVNAALFKPVPVPGGSRLVAITSRTPGNGDDRLSYPEFLDYRAQAHSFAALEGASDQEGEWAHFLWAESAQVARLAITPWPDKAPVSRQRCYLFSSPTG